MRPKGPAWAAALGAALIASGCRANGELAAEWRALVSVGMTQDEVFEQLGSPSAVRVDSGPPIQDHWTYRVLSEQGPSPLRVVGTVLLVAFFAVLVAAAVKGGGGGGGGSAESLREFTVTFDGTGRVAAVSDIRRVR